MGDDRDDKPLTGEILPAADSTPDIPTAPTRPVVFYAVASDDQEQEQEQTTAPRKGAIAGLLVVQLAAGTAGVLGAAVSFWQVYGFEHFGSVLMFGALCAILAGTHAAVVIWTLRTRPGRLAATIAQTPYVAAYALLLAWWWTWVPLGAVPWATAFTAGCAWSVVWYLRHPRTRRRTIALGAVLALVVGVNGAGLAAYVWKSSSGFGFVGQPNPWDAFNQLTAASCISDLNYYSRADKTIEADCPSGPTADFYAGDYDETALADILCSDQPRAAFARWWNWNKQYRVTIRLTFTPGDTLVDGKRMGPPFPVVGSGNDIKPLKVDGKAATMVANVKIDRINGENIAADPGVRTNKNEETWNIRFEPVSLGGWKVCGIDVIDPIQLNKN